MNERTAGHVALQETPAQPPSARTECDAGSAEAAALLQGDHPAAAQLEETQRAA